MNLDTLKLLGQIAGIGGIAFGVFLILFREVIRKKIFPKLTKQQGFRVILIFLFLVWSIAVVGIVGWFTLQNKKTSGDSIAEEKILNVKLWKVDLDTKGALLGSESILLEKDFANLNQIVDNLSAKLGVKNTIQNAPILVNVEVPSNLLEKNIKITRKPDGPMEIMFWDNSGNNKIRSRLDLNIIREMRNDFHLEINVPGYGTRVVEVKWGQGIDKSMELTPDKISIGIEDFKHDTVSAADKLVETLSNNNKFVIVSPDILKTIREEIQRHNENIRRNPRIQKQIRELGVDYILSGSIVSNSN